MQQNEVDDNRKWPVVLGRVNLSFYAVVGAVVQKVLERLGHEVEVREGSHPDIYPPLAKGEVDLLCASWLPNAHKEYWDRYKDDLAELSTLYTGAQFFWAVPSYVPEDEVSSVEDLVRDEVAAKMEKTITAVGPGSGLAVASRKMMDDYSLEESGYSFTVTDQPEWVSALEDAIEKESWIAHPLWRPQFLNRAHDLRPLAEPKGLLGNEDRASLTAHRSFPDKLPPETTQTLSRISLSLEDVTNMDYTVNVNGKSVEEVAEDWMQSNRDTVDSWFRR